MRLRRLPALTLTIGGRLIRAAMPGPRVSSGTCVLVAAIIMLSGCAARVSAGPLIERVWTDKAQYRAGDDVVVSVQLHNLTGATWQGGVFVDPTHLGHSLGLAQQQPLTIAADATQTLNFTFATDSPTDRGYLAEIQCIATGGGVTEVSATAFDFAADWTRFPRYGFLTRFTTATLAADVIDPLCDYKINVVQYYDWMDEHHLPYRSGYEFWQDIAKRVPWVSRAKLNELIAAGHDYNIAALAYDLMYGAYDDYLTDSDVRLTWGMFTVPLGSGYTLAQQDRHELGIAGWETQRLYLFNPSSQDWRDYIAQQFQQVFANITFDGWHIDTLGYRGPVYDSDGIAFDLDDAYPGFVNGMRTQLGSAPYLVVNAAGAYGLSQIAADADVDVVYAELWSSADQDDFFDLRLIADAVRANTTKPLVIAGYVNYNTALTYTAQNPGTFNEPSILLADAAIFANGAWHIELGDGLNMLSREYFPQQTLVMSASTQEKLRNYYDFAVAYENLLRDGTDNGDERIDLDLGGTTPTSYTGSAGAVWKLSKRRVSPGDNAAFDIAHFINLISVGTTAWRDPDSTSVAPTEILNKPARLYYHGPWGNARVWYASPDYLAGAATEVTDYTNAFDSGQNQWYIEFTLPSLRYWTMAWLERPQSPYATTPAAIPGLIEAEDFDIGGEEIAFHDCDAVNQGGAYRPSEGVDLEAASEHGFDVGWMCAGEWIEYTTEVACSADYWLDIRVASGSAGGALHFEADGVDICASVSVPDTGDWQNWATVSTRVTLDAGEHFLRFVNDADAGSAYNLNWFAFTRVGDADADGNVDFADAELVFTELGTDLPQSPADLNRDGAVDLCDVALLQTVYEPACP